MRTETKDFFLGIIEMNFMYDVVIIAETWLCEGVFSSEHFPNDYLVYRKDIGYSITQESRGGGVLLAAKRTIQSEFVDTLLCIYLQTVRIVYMSVYDAIIETDIVWNCNC